MAWEIVVGIETHAQLLTKSKIFSRASTAFGADPNTQASAVDLALPGTLPVLNKHAVELAIRFGLAVQGRINSRSVFARKNYFYPDLPKGYQISQYELPVVQGGSLTVDGKTVRITRAHLEEDAGKSLHEDFHGMTGIDLNRAGTPLLEIVTEPDLRGAKEAVAYAKALHGLVTWIGICDGNMQEGSFRCDANVSVRKQGSDELGTRCEIKNLNSFRFMEEAIQYEAQRQIGILEDGGKIDQETRLYDPDKGETRSMRSKEDAQDYRYFPDPDLLPLVISETQIEKIRAQMPELPAARLERIVADYLLGRELAQILVAERTVADYFEEALEEVRSLVQTMPLERFQVPADERSQAASFVLREVAVTGARLAANLIVGEIAAYRNRKQLAIQDCPVGPKELAALIVRQLDKTISGKTVKDVLDAMWDGQGSADDVIEKKGLRQISDAGTIEKLVEEAIAAGAKQVADYRAGKEKALQSLVGQVMKASKGKANPAQVNEILRRKLGG